MTADYMSEEEFKLKDFLRMHYMNWDLPSNKKTAVWRCTNKSFIESARAKMPTKQVMYYLGSRKKINAIKTTESGISAVGIKLKGNSGPS